MVLGNAALALGFSLASWATEILQKSASGFSNCAVVIWQASLPQVNGATVTKSVFVDNAFCYISKVHDLDQCVLAFEKTATQFE